MGCYACCMEHKNRELGAADGPAVFLLLMIVIASFFFGFNQVRTRDNAQAAVQVDSTRVVDVEVTD